MVNFEEAQWIKKIQSSSTRDLAKKVEKHVAFYPYQQAREIIETFLYPRFSRADCTENNRGLIYFLYGGYHTGKSHLLRYYAYFMKKLHPEVWKYSEAPVIKIDLNNHINTAEQLLLFILEKLGRPVESRTINYWKRTNSIIERLRIRLIALLEELGTRVLIMDECQKLLISRNPDITDIFELLKDLTTKHNWSGELRTQIVLCGTKDGIPLLEAADWIQGRTMTIKLCELEIQEFVQFLRHIYAGLIKLGLSDEWDLVVFKPETKKKVLNRELAQYLYQRTQGKVGLTVDLIRNAVILALDRGRTFPIMEDYESVRLSDKSYVFSKTKIPKKPIKKHIKKKKVTISLHDRFCTIKGCHRSKNPYKRYKPLIDHYKRDHPDIELVFEKEELI